MKREIQVRQGWGEIRGGGWEGRVTKEEMNDKEKCSILDKS